MSVTCKFSKRVTLIPGKSTWKAKDWAIALLSRLELMDWGLPKAIIFDRDRKFLADLWKIIFDRLGVKLLYSTAYHPQTDGQSERTNQTVEIALRYHLASIQDIKEWSKVLSVIQAHINNIKTSLGKISNEIVYGFFSMQPWDFLKEPTTTDDYTRFRKQVSDIMAWTQMAMKHIYDRKHRSLDMKPEDYVLLRLHKGYNIPATKTLGKKLSDQYAGPFKILEKIGNLAYRLNLSNHWKIHSVIFVAQLESTSDPSTDSHSRPRSNEPGPVEMEGDIDKVKSFEIEKLIHKRITARRGIEYLVRWKGWGPQYDEWRNIPELQNALELINEYEKSMENTTALSDRLPRKNPITKSPQSLMENPPNLSSPNTSNMSTTNQDPSIRRSTRTKATSRGRGDFF
jgi:hypothetical protein